MVAARGFRKAGPAAQARAVAAHRERSERNRADVTSRLLAAYRAEADRDYAEAFYGDMLRERGAYPA